MYAIPAGTGVLPEQIQPLVSHGPSLLHEAVVLAGCSIRWRGAGGRFRGAANALRLLEHTVLALSIHAGNVAKLFGITFLHCTL